ncbi:MAG: hypothetical protein ACKO3T_27985 [Planctomycetaceae bacterium]
MTTKTAEQRIAETLQVLEWQIADARKDLKKAAEGMMRRAIEAKESVERMMNDQPCSQTWTEFADADLRTAKEARACLEKLIETQKMVKHLAGG